MLSPSSIIYPIDMIKMCRVTCLSDNWDIIPLETKQKIRASTYLLRYIPERDIRSEVLKAISTDKPSNFFRALLDCGILGYVFPDLFLGIGCDQNEFHAETVWEHLLAALDASTLLTDNVYLRLAVLCHDIGKPHVKSEEDGSVHFYKHEVEGAEITSSWMKSLRFPKEKIAYVRKLVRHHQFRFEGNPADKTVRRWLYVTGKDTWLDLLILRMADRKGNFKKIGRPLITIRMRELATKIHSLLDKGAPIFKEDLVIDVESLIEKPSQEKTEIVSNLMGIVYTNPDKNSREWLEAYARRYEEDR